MARKKQDKKAEAPPEPKPEDLISPEDHQVARALQIWSHDDTGHDLTIDQAMFCRSYIIDRNPVAALRRLNYSDPPARLKLIAEKYLDNTEVKACIDTLAKQMMDRLAITADNVNQRIAAVAFFDPRTVMEFDHTGLSLKHSRHWTKEEAAAIQSIKQGKDGVELKLYDGLRAAEMLGKQLGTLQDDTEEARALSTKAAAEEVLTTIADIFRKTREARRHEIIDVKSLPAPEE